MLTAAFNVLLSRYSGHEDVVLGIPIANRDRPELLSLFGFLIDFQALRTDLSGNPTFRELLAASGRGFWTSTPTGGSRSTWSSRRSTRRATCPARRSSRPCWCGRIATCKCNIMDLEGLATSHVAAHPGIAKFDLTVWLTDVEDDIWAEVEYCTDLFDADMIRCFMEAFRVLLQAVAADPEGRLTGLPVLTSEVRQRSLVEWNKTQTEYPRAPACMS